MPLEMMIVDLCTQTEYVGQEPAIPALLEATALGPEVCYEFAEPLTQIAIDLGIARICGAPTYELEVLTGSPNQQYLTLDAVNKELCINSNDLDDGGEQEFKLVTRSA